MAPVISAHEARLKASRAHDADRAYAAVSAALANAFARIEVASQKGYDSVMYTVMPAFHGLNEVHASQAARETAEALRRKGYTIHIMSLTDMVISWATDKKGQQHKENKSRDDANVPAEDLWRFARRRAK